MVSVIREWRYGLVTKTLPNRLNGRFPVPPAAVTTWRSGPGTSAQWPATPDYAARPVC
jgi:hypothetical protein